MADAESVAPPPTRPVERARLAIWRHGRYALVDALARSVFRPSRRLHRALPANAVTHVPDGPHWAFEVKHDGYRFIARRDGDRVRVFSRHGKDWTDQVPAIVEGMLALPVSATVDGEGVVCDEWGVTDFGRLRTALAVRGGSRAVFLYGFDLLTIDGEDLRRHPWEIRRATLTRLLRKAGTGIRLSEHLDGDGETIFRHACALGAEGIVAKRRDRPYRSGRSPDWVKVKNPNAPAASRIMEWQ
jgi:bifunctional non-homologous end joining protein LigD